MARGFFRRQRVVLRDSISDWKEVLSGVPQGYVLGPLLFVLYINDLPEVAGNNMKQYADDSKILAKIYYNKICNRSQENLQLKKTEYKKENGFLSEYHTNMCKTMLV